jgi:hypothetical protein
MVDSLEAEKLVLENWKRERADLDAAISALERKIAARGGSTSVTLGNGGQVAADEFFRLSTPDAIKKFLKIVGKPARAATDIIDGLKSGGMNASYTNVYTALTRLKAKGDVAKVGDNWGLEEWYPPAAFREGKALADLSTGELVEVAEKFIAEGDKQKQNIIETGDKAHGSKKGRKEEIAEFIRTHGPSTRSEILAGTNVPDGTISYCLKDVMRFVQDNDGKWRNVE